MRTIAPTRFRIHLDLQNLTEGGERRLRSYTPSRLVGYQLDQWLTVTSMWGQAMTAKLFITVQILTRSARAA